MPYWMFWAVFQKAIIMFEISSLTIYFIAKVDAKKKSLNFEPKMPDLGIFGLEFENNFVIFEISAFEFVYLQNFVKMSKFATKNTLWVFCTGILKDYCHI